jgi:hypothetical protein
MKSTAIYYNRVLDKKRLEFDLSLEEFGTTETQFFLPNEKLFTVGYERIVYGDHGPYIEFKKENIVEKLIGKYNEVDEFNLPNNPKFYYFWMYPKSYFDLKVYLQLKSVKNLPNAPKRKDGRPSCFNRVEGYADYKRGFYYVDPYDLIIK